MNSSVYPEEGQEYQQVINSVKKKYSGKKPLRVEFEVEIYWKIRERTQEKRGTFYLNPGDRFRVETGKSVYVCDGQTFWQYNKESNQVIIKNLLDVSLSMHPSQQLSDYLQLDYDIQKRDGDKIVLNWKGNPDDIKEQYNTIRIVIDKDDAEVTEMYLLDKNGNKTTYRFKKTESGINIDKSKFKFEIPEGVDVFDSRD
ncbi:MAG: LolA family protein [Chitinivibrionales bacterium]